MPSSPVLSEKYFHPQQAQAGWAAPTIPGPPSQLPQGAPAAPLTGDVMTVRGTMSATAVLFAILLVGAFVGWLSVEQTTGFALDATGDLVEVSTTSLPGWFFAAVFGAFGIAMLTIFKSDLARFTAPVYALVEGAALGALSAVYEYAYDGIVLQAVLATFGVFLGMLVLYSTGVIKVTDKFRRNITAAMFGILIMYMAGFVFSMFGSDIRFWNEPSAMGIGITMVIVGVAAFRLALDFDFIERASAAGVPKRMEWFAAFGLMVGLVWLYLEILRLLSLLRER